MKHRWIAVMFFVLPMVHRAAEPSSAMIPIGVARIDITPAGPIWLSGYNNRPRETEEVVRRLYARAIAIGGDDDEGAAVLLAVEATGVTENLSEAVAAGLKKSHGVPRSRVAICAAHIHTGPAIDGLLPFLYGRDLPDKEAMRIARYTRWLRARLIEVAQTALENRKENRRRPMDGHRRRTRGGSRSRAAGIARNRRAGESSRRPGQLRVPLHDAQERG